MQVQDFEWDHKRYHQTRERNIGGVAGTFDLAIAYVVLGLGWSSLGLGIMVGFMMLLT